MTSYQLSHKAVEDLADIRHCTFDTWSELQADKYYFILLETCQLLADGNLSGKPYPELSAEILGYKAGRHIIFYRIAKNSGIEVARILHRRMDLKKRMED